MDVRTQQQSASTPQHALLMPLQPAASRNICIAPAPLAPAKLSQPPTAVPHAAIQASASTNAAPMYYMMPNGTIQLSHAYQQAQQQFHMAQQQMMAKPQSTSAVPTAMTTSTSAAHVGMLQPQHHQLLPATAALAMPPSVVAYSSTESIPVNAPSMPAVSAAAVSTTAAPTTATPTAPTIANTPRKRKKVLQIVSELPARLLDSKRIKPATKPQQVLMQLLTPDKPKTHSCTTIPDFFHDPTQAEIDAYDTEILAIVRTRDMDRLREYHTVRKRPLKCSNRFGESLLHLACRKGFVDVATYLLQEVPMQIKDDFGRTPLHDACWTCAPNFELMDVLIEACPDLLFVADVRGHVPLDYTRRQHWDQWNDYLRGKTAEQLRPRQLK